MQTERLHLPIMVHVGADVNPHDVLEFLGRCASSMSAPLWLQAAQPVVDARVHEGGYDFVADYEALSRRFQDTQTLLMNEIGELRQRLAESDASRRALRTWHDTEPVTGPKA